MGWKWWHTVALSVVWRPNKVPCRKSFCIHQKCIYDLESGGECWSTLEALCSLNRKLKFVEWSRIFPCFAAFVYLDLWYCLHCKPWLQYDRLMQKFSRSSLNPWQQWWTDEGCLLNQKSAKKGIMPALEKVAIMIKTVGKYHLQW